jgi:hypothetical protein
MADTIFKIAGMENRVYNSYSCMKSLSVNSLR